MKFVEMQLHRVHLLLLYFGFPLFFKVLPHMSYSEWVFEVIHEKNPISLWIYSLVCVGERWETFPEHLPTFQSGIFYAFIDRSIDF